jgi:hypothetical protein
VLCFPRTFASFQLTAFWSGAGVSICFTSAARHLSTSPDRLSFSADGNEALSAIPYCCAIPSALCQSIGSHLGLPMRREDLENFFVNTVDQQEMAIKTAQVQRAFAQLSTNTAPTVAGS